MQLLVCIYKTKKRTYSYHPKQIAYMSTRKELINEYKQTKFRAGVFQIRNTVETSHSIDLSAFPKGMYVVQVTDGVHTIVRKVLTTE